MLASDILLVEACVFERQFGADQRKLSKAVEPPRLLPTDIIENFHIGLTCDLRAQVAGIEVRDLADTVFGLLLGR